MATIYLVIDLPKKEHTWFRTLAEASYPDNVRPMSALAQGWLLEMIREEMQEEAKRR